MACKKRLLCWGLLRWNYCRPSAPGSLLEDKSARLGFSPQRSYGVIESNAEQPAQQCEFGRRGRYAAAVRDVTSNERVTNLSKKITTLEQLLSQRVEAMRDDPCGITQEAVESLWGSVREASKAVSAAMDNYEADLNVRRAALDKQATELNAEIGRIKGEIAVLEDQSREAASRGDLDTAAERDEKADALRKRLSAASRKRRIATGARLKGDAQLFAAVKAARAEYENAAELCRKCVEGVVALIAQWAEHFEKLAQKTDRIPNYCPRMDDRRFEKLDKDFNTELYAKIEAQAEKDRREREEAWEAEKARRRAAGNFYAM